MTHTQNGLMVYHPPFPSSLPSPYGWGSAGLGTSPCIRAPKGSPLLERKHAYHDAEQGDEGDVTYRDNDVGYRFESLHIVSFLRALDRPLTRAALPPEGGHLRLVDVYYFYAVFLDIREKSIDNIFF